MTRYPILCSVKIDLFHRTRFLMKAIKIDSFETQRRNVCCDKKQTIKSIGICDNVQLL